MLVKNKTNGVYSTKQEQTEALTAELEHSVHASLRQLEQLKGDVYVKEFVSKLPLPC